LIAFEYHRLGGKSFIARNQSLLYLLWLLIAKRAILPEAIGKRALAKLLKAKLTPAGKSQVLRLPVNGTWCRSVRGGFKVFDVGRKSVIKVYASDTDKAVIHKEIELFSKVGNHAVAPALRNWDIGQGWYEEEFITGLSSYALIPIAPAEQVMDRYFEFIEPTLEKMILAGSPASVSVLPYVETLERSLDAGNGRPGDQDVKKAHAFIHEAAGRIRDLAGDTGTKIHLAFCHGDFHQFNMFWTGSALRLIDWEAAQRLSMLFDFYNFFLSQLYLDNVSPDWPAQVAKALESLRRRLAREFPQVAENLCECAELYRLVYYIERTHTFLGSFGLDSWKISKWIEAFGQFEESAGGRRFGLNPPQAAVRVA
jgi:hypothetical protein